MGTGKFKRVNICRANTLYIYTEPRVPQCLSPRRTWAPHPLSPQRVSSPPPNQRGGGGGTHSPACDGARPRRGSPNSDDWRESLVLCLLCDRHDNKYKNLIVIIFFIYESWSLSPACLPSGGRGHCAHSRGAQMDES